MEIYLIMQGNLAQFVDFSLVTLRTLWETIVGKYLGLTISDGSRSAGASLWAKLLC